MNGREALVRRYRYLWTGELVAAVGFLLLFVLTVPLDQSWRSWILRAYGITVFLAILAQGSCWWWGRLHDLRARRQRPRLATLRRFGRLRQINWGLIAAFPLVVWWMSGSPGVISPGDLGWGTLLIVAAAIEQVNYFHYQLSYGYGLDVWYLRRHRRPRRGNIARYLDAEPGRESA